MTVGAGVRARRARRGMPVHRLQQRYSRDREYTTGEIIAEHTLDPVRDYHPKKQQSPSRKRG